MYAEREEPEADLEFNADDPVEREIYQIFLNIWENSKAFFEYWTSPNNPLHWPREQQVRPEIPREVQGTRVQTKRASQHVHKRMLQLARDEASGSE